MSTFTAVGPALAIDGPLPVAPQYSLLSIPGVIVGDGDRWMNGVNVYGYPSDVPSLWEPCSTGTYRTKIDGDDQPQARFDAIVAYLPITCSAMSIGRWDEFLARAEKVLQATISFAIEEALSQGVVLSTNPYFADANLSILAGGAAVTPAVGLSYLENAIGATGRVGMIHATPAVISAWGVDELETGEFLNTFNGTPVASGGGYIGADPVLGAGPAAGQSWVFASGPVEVRLSEMILLGDDPQSALDTSNNDVTLRAEMYALPVWDTALQAGALIDWSP